MSGNSGKEVGPSEETEGDQIVTQDNPQQVEDPMLVDELVVEAGTIETIENVPVPVDEPIPVELSFDEITLQAQSPSQNQDNSDKEVGPSEETGGDQIVVQDNPQQEEDPMPVDELVVEAGTIETIENVPVPIDKPIPVELSCDEITLQAQSPSQNEDNPQQEEDSILVDELDVDAGTIETIVKVPVPVDQPIPVESSFDEITLQAQSPSQNEDEEIARRLIKEVELFQMLQLVLPLIQENFGNEVGPSEETRGDQIIAQDNPQQEVDPMLVDEFVVEAGTMETIENLPVPIDKPIPVESLCDEITLQARSPSQHEQDEEIAKMLVKEIELFEMSQLVLPPTHDYSGKEAGPSEETGGDQIVAKDNSVKEAGQSEEIGGDQIVAKDNLQQDKEPMPVDEPVTTSSPMPAFVKFALKKKPVPVDKPIPVQLAAPSEETEADQIVVKQDEKIAKRIAEDLIQLFEASQLVLSPAEQDEKLAKKMANDLVQLFETSKLILPSAQVYREREPGKNRKRPVRGVSRRGSGIPLLKTQRGHLSKEGQRSPVNEGSRGGSRIPLSSAERRHLSREGQRSPVNEGGRGRSRIPLPSCRTSPPVKSKCSPQVSGGVLLTIPRKVSKKLSPIPETLEMDSEEAQESSQDEMKSSPKAGRRSEMKKLKSVYTSEKNPSPHPINPREDKELEHDMHKIDSSYLKKTLGGLPTFKEVQRQPKTHSEEGSDESPETDEVEKEINTQEKESE